MQYNAMYVGSTCFDRELCVCVCVCVCVYVCVKVLKRELGLLNCLSFIFCYGYVL